MKQYCKKIFFPKILDYRRENLGAILLSMSVFFLNLPSFFDLKIWMIFILIGLVLILFINRKNISDSSNKKQVTNIQLMLSIILLILITYVIVKDLDVDIFVILFIIEVITLKELLGKFLSSFLQKRLNLFIYILLVLFVIIIVKRIISISNM